MTKPDLQFRQIDSALQPFSESRPPAPQRGWLRAIRNAIGMTTAQLARRLSTSQSAVTEFEQREVAGSITLATLRRIADAMHCDLVYAVVPRRPLGEMIQARAEEVARKKLAPVAHSMRLEDQAVSNETMEQQVKQLAKELIERRRSELWK